MANPLFVRDSSRKPIIGMIHVPALPGTPRGELPISEVVEYCVNEARLYAELGIEAIAIENMHDRPYVKGHSPPEIVAAMTAVATAVRSAVPDHPCGIQILAAANKEALGVALAADLEFVRVEGFVFAHIADEGEIESDAASLLRYRKQIGAENVKIITDIKKKHSSHAITADLDVAETAKAAEFFLSDGLVVTGSNTGAAPAIEDMQAARNATTLPLVIGSGMTPDNAAQLWPRADAAIVGSTLKKDGHWANAVDPERVRRLVAAPRS